jgi:hypothetical protein
MGGLKEARRKTRGMRDATNGTDNASPSSYMCAFCRNASVVTTIRADFE